nr:hypothetical protein SYMBAF_20339 [Serratia symbiotica]
MNDFFILLANSLCKVENKTGLRAYPGKRTLLLASLRRDST